VRGRGVRAAGRRSPARRGVTRRVPYRERVGCGVGLLAVAAAAAVGTVAGAGSRVSGRPQWCR
jgi:hypothetical protein